MQDLLLYNLFNFYSVYFNRITKIRLEEHISDKKKMKGKKTARPFKKERHFSTQAYNCQFVKVFLLKIQDVNKRNILHPMYSLPIKNNNNSNKRAPALVCRWW